MTSLVDFLHKNILSRKINLSATYFSTAPRRTPTFCCHKHFGYLVVGETGGAGRKTHSGLGQGLSVKGRCVLVREPGARVSAALATHRDMIQSI